MSKADALHALEKKWRGCIKCPVGLWATRHVLSRGSENARVLFIGEAPSRSEEFIGRPFLGRAGRLLDNAIKAAGGSKDDCYFTNLVACRPSDCRGGKSRPPDDDEVENCSPRLTELVGILAPRVVVWLGRGAQDWSHLYPTPGAVAFHLQSPAWVSKVGGEKSRYFKYYVEKIREVFNYASET